MDVAKKLIKSLRIPIKPLLQDETVEYSAYAMFGIAALYIFYRGQLATLGLAIGVAMMVFAVTGALPVSLFAGALLGLLALRSRGAEGFEDAAAPGAKKQKEEEEHAAVPHEGFEEDATDEEGVDDAEEGDAAAEGFEDDAEVQELLEEGFANVPSSAGAGKKRRKGKKPLPDHRDRQEMFELGKKYKMPKEEDDGDYHLDAGTTFLNAYKSLKPDQIAAMTKDTQELMQTQRQLMSTLSTLKPLIQDGKEMMNMFQSYFGSGTPSAN